MGDERTCDYICALCVVSSDYYPFSHEVLGHVSTRIIKEVRGINRVVFGVTLMQPKTIEREYFHIRRLL